MSQQQWQPKDVAIFGAGIAGLTAAHELIERGFRVEVFEMEGPSLGEDTCSIGGVARTQWARAERPPAPYEAAPPQSVGMVATKPLRLDLEAPITDKARTFILFDQWSDQPLQDPPVTQFQSIAADMNTLGATYGSTTILVLGYVDAREQYSDVLPGAGGGPARPHRAVLALNRATRVADQLRPLLSPAGTITLLPVAVGIGCADDWAAPEFLRRRVDFQLRQDYVPGEHGFRFFPSFYRNVRDSMRRTPLALATEPFVETPLTVYDNLVGLDQQGVFVRPPGKSMVMPRRPLRSAHEYFTVLRDSLRTMDWELRDVERYALKLFKFMTSCPARRREYEAQSWADFVGAEDLSPGFRQFLDRMPKLLLAMSGDECDARTFGNVSVQLMMDHFVASDRTDATLNGPTSQVWFLPWRRYLEHQGVRFRRARLVGFHVVDSEVAWPVVIEKDHKPTVNGDECGCFIFDPNDRPAYTYVHVVRDYSVIALSLERIREILSYPNYNRTTVASEFFTLTGNDVARIKQMRVDGDTEEHQPGEMRHLSGIQFYFPSEAKFLPGHIVYPDSEWNLSSIAQPQFWSRKRGWWDGYRGLITVAIGDWSAVGLASGPGAPPPGAWHSTRQQIAEQVWRQIQAAHPHPEMLPTPRLFHLDDYIKFRNDKPYRNCSRFLINLPGRYDERPGRLSPGDQDGYELCHSSIVFAGSYMKTRTRLTTMEAANESGRHAVNAILGHSKFQGDRCAISNPENNEFDDLKFFVDLDRRLKQAGLPHLVDIVDPEGLPDAWLRADCDPETLLSGLAIR